MPCRALDRGSLTRICACILSTARVCTLPQDTHARGFAGCRIKPGKPAPCYRPFIEYHDPSVSQAH